MLWTPLLIKHSLSRCQIRKARIKLTRSLCSYLPGELPKIASFHCILEGDLTLKLDSSPENNDCVTASNLCSASGVVSDFEGVHTRRKVTVPLGLQTRGLGGMFPQTIFKFRVMEMAFLMFSA